jgi:hypothetical protein
MLDFTLPRLQGEGGEDKDVLIASRATEELRIEEEVVNGYSFH